MTQMLYKQEEGATALRDYPGVTYKVFDEDDVASAKKAGWSETPDCKPKKRGRPKKVEADADKA